MLAVVAARRGSVRCPAKNLAEIAGRSLIRRALDVALACEAIDDVVLLTDYERDEAAGEGLAREWGDCLRYVREPHDLAAGTTPIEEVVRHALLAPGRCRAEPVRHVVLLNPTSPFRTVETVTEAIRVATPLGGAVTARLEPATGHTLDRVSDVPWPRAAPASVIVHGAAIVCPAPALCRERPWRLLGPAPAVVLTPRHEAVDIDTRADLDHARALCAAYDGRL